MKLSLQNLSPWQKQLLGGLVGGVVALGGYQAYAVVSPLFESAVQTATHTAAPDYTAETRSAKQDEIIRAAKQNVEMLEQEGQM